MQWDGQPFSRRGPTSQQWEDWAKTDSGKGPTELWWSLRNGGTGTMKFKTILQMSRDQFGGYGEMEMNMLELRMS
jgi:hypothetical protein